MSDTIERDGIIEEIRLFGVNGERSYVFGSSLGVIRISPYNGEIPKGDKVFFVIDGNRDRIFSIMIFKRKDVLSSDIEVDADLIIQTIRSQYEQFRSSINV